MFHSLIIVFRTMFRSLSYVLFVPLAIPGLVFTFLCALVRSFRRENTLTLECKSKGKDRWILLKLPPTARELKLVAKFVVDSRLRGREYALHSLGAHTKWSNNSQSIENRPLH